MDEANNNRETPLEYFTMPTVGYGPFIVFGCIIFVLLALVLGMLWVFSKHSATLDVNAMGGGYQNLKKGWGSLFGKRK